MSLQRYAEMIRACLGAQTAARVAATSPAGIVFCAQARARSFSDTTPTGRP